METGNYVTRSNGMHNDLPFRIIARLDVKTGHVIKGVQLEGLRKVGIPEIMAKRYYQHGADELLFMDAVASLYDRNHLASLLETTTHEVFIPLSVGGGNKTVFWQQRLLTSPQGHFLWGIITRRCFGSSGGCQADGFT